jgi:pimeloyl-ACP methyl ester carboxylesterase
MKDWSLLSGDLLRALKPLGRKKVIGIGHSLGGVLTLTAALREPERFSRIILIDATMPDPAHLLLFEGMRRLGLTPREDLVKGALRRRRHWDSREAAFRAFAGKPLFQSWKQGVLRDYVEGMTAPSPQGGVDLVYPPEWEARIYQTIPTDVWKGVHGLKVPVLVIRGENSNTFTARSEKAFARRLPSARLEKVPGAGHLVPFEKPAETADLILDFLGA